MEVIMSLCTVRGLRTFNGPNVFLPQKAVSFRLNIKEDGGEFSNILEELERYLPNAAKWSPESLADLFIKTVIEIEKMDMELYVSFSSCREIDPGTYEVAVELIDEHIGEEAVYLAEELLNNCADRRTFGFEREFQGLQAAFSRTLYGGPTLYSIIHAAYHANIPTFYLSYANQFQWGYGRRQVRGRSTTVSTDGIKDTEFTCFKDTVKEFLADAGLPVPRGGVFTRLEPALEMAEELGFPVVVKPVSGHKGQGVTTNIQSLAEVEEAFTALLEAEVKGGIIVEQQVTGHDHRLLTVGGKCVAALKRVPAYVIGDGRGTIEELIEKENQTFVRRNNARSPLASINIDDDLQAYLRLQDLRLNSVLDEGQQVFLRRVANISAGGVSINVTDKIHPDNELLAEHVAAFLNLTILGVDVLADDITKSWRESPLSIIEINAGPGVFMHLAPAQGESIDVPGMIMKSLFHSGGRGRIPILVFSRLSRAMQERTTNIVRSSGQDLIVGSASAEGVYFDGKFLSKNERQWTQVAVLLRHQHLDAAIIEYRDQDIVDDGLRYAGADIVCLLEATEAEQVLARDIEDGGWLLVAKDLFPLAQVPERVKVAVIDVDGELSTPPEGADVLATIRDGVPVFLGGGFEGEQGEADESLSLAESITASFLAKIMPVVVDSYCKETGGA